MTQFRQEPSTTDKKPREYALSQRQLDFFLAVGATGRAHAQQRRILCAPGLPRAAVVDARGPGRRDGCELKDLRSRVDARREVTGAEGAVTVLAVALARAEGEDVDLLLHGAADGNEALRELAVARAEVPPRVLVLRGAVQAALLHVLLLAA